MGSSLDVERLGPVLVVRVRGPEFRAAEAASLLALVAGSTKPVRAGVVLDLSTVTKVDSAALGAIAQLNAGQRFRIVGLAPLVESVLGILGILPTLTVLETTDAAVANLRRPVAPELVSVAPLPIPAVG